MAVDLASHVPQMASDEGVEAAAPLSNRMGGVDAGPGTQPEGVDDGWHDVATSRDRAELDEPDPLPETTRSTSRLQGQASLAHPADSDDRHQAVGAKSCREPRQVLFSPHEDVGGGPLPTAVAWQPNGGKFLLGEHMTGSIDDVRLYDRVLTAEEVRAF